jgi:hypothetical protein
MTHPLEHHAFTVVLLCISTGTGSSFDGNREWNGMLLAKPFDLNGIQVIQVVQKRLPRPSAAGRSL